ncbi:GtrA family protein [Corynebacterium godavarianum]|uniref:GtrA family protein n=1 Tax=Corynebacterium godavarianum TaxID=2054421 RepID=A0ABY3E7D4_9CORY|nr:GtrA family protein [Corynebacterium godavarianum]MBL7285627.1 GtrA family protein [Corynebacterium godavarianum]TSJ75694.1 GtrA family protein [Corynebacterium godavarianum]
MANGLREFIKFGLVGGSGVVVNLAIFYVAKKSLEAGLDLHEADALMSIPGTRFNIRWYHLLSTLAFVIANVWNYQLNRSWTFRKIEQRNWFAGFFPFLATGAIAFLVSLTFMTLFMNPTSPIALPDHIFDDSSGLRTKSYWAQGLSTIIATPVNFIINKLWAFAKPKPTAPHAGE